MCNIRVWCKTSSWMKNLPFWWRTCIYILSLPNWLLGFVYIITRTSRFKITILTIENAPYIVDCFSVPNGPYILELHVKLCDTIIPFENSVIELGWRPSIPKAFNEKSIGRLAGPFRLRYGYLCNKERLMKSMKHEHSKKIFQQNCTCESSTFPKL